MRRMIVACVVALAVGGAASAQGYSGYQGYKPPAAPIAGQEIKAPEPPKFPKPPKPPEFATPPRFKPFEGQHIGTANNGVDPYPKPKKPKGGFSTYDGH